MKRCVNQIRKEVAQKTLEKLGRKIVEHDKEILKYRKEIARLEQLRKRAKKVFDKYSQ